MLGGLIFRMHTTLGRSRVLTNIALKLRNQSAFLVRCHMYDTFDFRKNGEERLAKWLGASTKTFIDVGANRGDWTDMLLKHAPGAQLGILIEPSLKGAEILRSHFASEPRVTTLQAAAADQEGTMSFFEQPGVGVASSLVQGTAVGGIATVVPVVTLDQEANRRGIAQIDFLKIDAEGYDFHVLRGAAQLLQQKRIRALQFEYQTSWAQAGSTLAAALSFLAGFGYEVYLLKGKGLFKPNYAKYGEYFHYSNYVAFPSERVPELESLVVGEM